MAFLKEKLEAFEKFKIFKAMAKNESSMKIKCLRLDNGGEFTSNEFNSVNFMELRYSFQPQNSTTEWGS